MTDLREEWADLRARRRDLARPLDVYQPLIEQWARWPSGRPAPLGWSQGECVERWGRSLPLLAEARPTILPDDLEGCLATAMECVVTVKEDAVGGLERLAGAWDRGAVGPADLLPTKGGVGSAVAEREFGLAAEVVAFLVYASLRPSLEAYFADVRNRLDERVWELGVCPFCGAPPGFSDVLEDGRRRLACHLCGGGWIAARTRCPFCGSDRSQDLVRLEPTAGDQGYVVVACGSCRAYLKELDRRVRWNGRSALVEDWGSPHLDVAAARAGYRRPSPTLLGLA